MVEVHPGTAHSAHCHQQPESLDESGGAAYHMRPAVRRCLLAKLHRNRLHRFFLPFAGFHSLILLWHDAVFASRCWTSLPFGIKRVHIYPFDEFWADVVFLFHEPGIRIWRLVVADFWLWHPAVLRSFTVLCYNFCHLTKEHSFPHQTHVQRKVIVNVLFVSFLHSCCLMFSIFHEGCFPSWKPAWVWTTHTQGAGSERICFTSFFSWDFTLTTRLLLVCVPLVYQLKRSIQVADRKENHFKAVSHGSLMKFVSFVTLY